MARHADLAAVNGTEAQRDIVDSRARPERQLDGSVTHFSYPLGQRHHLTEDSRDLVRRSGYACCCGDDPFRLPWVAATPWHLSPAQFGFELLVQARGSAAEACSAS